MIEGFSLGRVSGASSLTSSWAVSYTHLFYLERRKISYEIEAKTACRTADALYGLSLIHIYEPQMIDKIELEVDAPAEGKPADFSIQSQELSLIPI